MSSKEPATSRCPPRGQTVTLHAEQVLGSFRIFAAAVWDERTGGYRAASVVLRLESHGLPVEVVFRGDSPNDGRRWLQADAAVRFGLKVGAAAAKNLCFLGGLVGVNSAPGGAAACQSNED